MNVRRSGNGRPTMVDVAADAGVSLKTVSRVVNGVDTVDPALATRVRTSIKKLGFQRNDVAASLRSGTETRTVGLITADLSNAFYSTISSAVAGVARERGYHVIMASSEESPEIEQATAIDLCRRRVSGLIVVPTESDHGYLRPQIARGIPVVFLDRPARGVEADTVLVDNRGGAESAMRSLIESGHRRIAVLLDLPEIFTTTERLEGATAAAAAAGIRLDPALISTGSHGPDHAFAAFSAMLATDDPPTAVLCSNNRITVGAVEAIWRAGARVDVAGFDDFEMSRLLPQPVTIVDYDTPALGRIAAEALFARIDGSEAPPERRLVPTRLVQRGGRLPDAP